MLLNTHTDRNWPKWVTGQKHCRWWTDQQLTVDIHLHDVSPLGKRKKGAKKSCKRIQDKKQEREFGGGGGGEAIILW